MEMIDAVISNPIARSNDIITLFILMVVLLTYNLYKGCEVSFILLSKLGVLFFMVSFIKALISYYLVNGIDYPSIGKERIRWNNCYHY